MPSYEGIATMSALEITFERGFYGAVKGDPWRAMFYDRASSRFYAASGSTAWEALAWALDDYYAVHVRGRGACMARDLTVHPGSDVQWANPTQVSDMAGVGSSSRMPTRTGAEAGSIPAPRTRPAAARRAAATKRKEG